MQYDHKTIKLDVQQISAWFSGCEVFGYIQKNKINKSCWYIKKLSLVKIIIKRRI